MERGKGKWEVQSRNKKKIEGRSRTKRGAMDPKWTQLGKYKKTKWIATLTRACPYGLNDKISDDIKSTKNEIIGLNFPSLIRMHDRMRGTKYISFSNHKGTEFIVKLCRYLIEDTSNAMNFLKSVSLNKKYLKNIGSFLSEEMLRLPFHFTHIQLCHTALDSIESKIYIQEPPKIKRKAPEYICHVTFSNKAVEMIPMYHLFLKAQMLNPVW